MKKIFDFLFSMPWMAFLILVMIFSTAMATFIENDFGPAAARAVVYNAWWFEVLLALIVFNLLGNMIRGKVYKKKLSIFVFHFAFLFIFLGAAITRYISYEGTMHIRENSSSDRIISSGSYLYAAVDDNSEQDHFYKETSFISGKKNRFSGKLKVGNEILKLKLLKYIPNAEKSLVPDPLGESTISLVSLGSMGRQSFLLKDEETEQISGLQIGFNKKTTDFNIFSKEEGLYFVCKSDVFIMDMASNTQDTLKAEELHPFQTRRLYTIESIQLVLTDYLKKGRVEWETGPNDGLARPDAIVLEASYKSQKEIITCFGWSDRIGKQYNYKLDGARLSLTYGPRSIQLPFALFLRDFQLEKYPGSNSPASYASEVTLIDNDNGLEKQYRIFMNNILDYKGYRFFQSYYDNDEKGTILSVNHDALGTAVTYIGYFLMTLGMLLSLFNKNSRFRSLARAENENKNKIPVIAVLLLFALTAVFPISANARQDTGGGNDIISTSQAAELASILVQDQGGRIKPLQSMTSDVVRKVAKKESVKGLNSVQVVMGMYFFPESWQRVPMIRVPNEEIRKVLGVNNKNASYVDFFNMTSMGEYKLASHVQQAYQKKPGLRTKYDQEVMKVDERVNICYMVYSGSLLRIFPAKNEPSQKWYSPDDAGQMLSSEDSLFVSGVLSLYRNSLMAEGDTYNLSEIVNGIKKFQELNAGEIYPSRTKTSFEIFYNKAHIFDKLAKYYGIIGFILLFLLLASVLSEKKGINKIIRLATFFLMFGFVMHTFGLGVRWYVSEHAPWSNGYESMIYIAWAAMLTGLIFVRKSAFTLVAASLLSALTLMVAHMSWMNPEITNLVPVLKSYWLTIHVSVITASYGFLGTGMVLGLFNLLLYIMKTEKNQAKLQKQIEILTRINEMALILGVYFISVGTFLGGVWANESWGRYWGWDPKETWALITALVYIFITHMKYVPGLKGHFAFNLASVVGFFSVLMTYFGVNYYLAGLHSYAQGEAVPIPKFVYYTIVSLVLLILFAWFNEKNFRKKTSLVE